MKTRLLRDRHQQRWLGLVIAAIALMRGVKLRANPAGMTVVSGAASAQQIGSRLNVTTSQLTILNWKSFNIAAGETTSFIQPNSSSIVFNQIAGANPSQIWGTLQANGSVILANVNGFYFGPNSMIKIGGSFIATTAPLAPDFGPGSAWTFTGMPPLASIVNYGSVQVGQGKSLFLIAEQIDNHGVLQAPGGNLGLYAGQQVLVSERPDGRSLSATVELPAGSVNNFGQVVADAGTIAVRAKVVNQDGILQADSVRDHNGVIELVASDQLNLGAAAQILARGDAAPAGSAGGTVTLKSDHTFSDASGSRIVTTGGAHGGTGGNIEVSAPSMLSLDSSMDARAQTGWTGGRFLLDPANITLGASGSGTVAASGTVGYNNGSGTLALNVNTAFANKNFSAIDLQATGNISLLANTVWNLSQSTGVTAGLLTLQAGGDIVFNNGSQILDANNWSVNLQAGVSFPAGLVQSGLGNIYLNGGSGKTLSGAISTAHGSISLTAGNSILAGTGYVHTTAGGSISATALAGDINAGTANGGYNFSILGYSVSPNLGGISTAAGGDVTLTAGHNLISTPTVPSGQPPGASGAYGKGDVTLSARNQILGNYLVANGVGTVLAGVQVENGQVSKVTSASADVGSSQRPVSLSLVRGSWNVFAARDIYIAEVRNPNGAFNGSQLSVPAGEFSGNLDNTTVPNRSAFLFDYAPDAAANFWAGNSITLAGSNLPRVSGQNQDMPPIYAPSLSLNAGAGGINLLNSILLYPSAEGSLTITTRDGGSLVGVQQQTTLTGITMSDSGLPGWATFSQGHGLAPLHLRDPNPVKLDISGNIESFGLTLPTFADISVGGNTYNFGFQGRNLSAAQATKIQVAGDITYRGNLTSVALADPLPSELLSSTLSGNSEVAVKLRYDAVTGTLTFIGQMASTELGFLLSPTVVALDSKGNPILDANGNPVVKAVTLTSAQQGAIQQLYASSQSASLGDQGLALAGPGKFSISARNIDLGISGGISVLAPDSALAAISPYGANLTITAAGNLDMTSTKIANESLLGGIDLSVAGTLNIGGQFTTYGDPNSPKGIFTTSGGSISVATVGNVNVNGSRIAAYDGGNVTIESFNGDVNAGSGGSGYVSMNALELDPATGQLVSIAASIPGSGILATTLPGSNARLGNVLAESPNGNISASVGGVLQLSFNATDASKALTLLLAGYELRDATGGSRLSAGDISAAQKTVGSGGSGVAPAPYNLVDSAGRIVGRLAAVSADRNIDASGSGVIGQNLNGKATGEVGGVFISQGDTDISAKKLRRLVVVGPKPPQIEGPSDPGDRPTIITPGDSKINGIDIPPEQTASTAPPPAPQAAPDSTQIAKQADGQFGAGDDETKKAEKSSGIVLARKTGRVTVLLPHKN